jgi:hypothetical protein
LHGRAIVVVDILLVILQDVVIPCEINWIVVILVVIDGFHVVIVVRIRNKQIRVAEWLLNSFIVIAGNILRMVVDFTQVDRDLGTLMQTGI